MYIFFIGVIKIYGYDQPKIIPLRYNLLAFKKTIDSRLPSRAHRYITEMDLLIEKRKKKLRNHVEF